MQYFAAVEPQRRLAPDVHIAIRGTVSRAELREVLAATYHQVWWPSTQTVKYDGDRLPIWDETSANYLDPAMGEVLPTWDQALGAIGEQGGSWHVLRFGDRFDAQGVLAGSKGASRCIGCLTKYLTKHVGDCHQASTEDRAAHAGRLAVTLRYEPHSPTCGTGSSPRTPGWACGQAGPAAGLLQGQSPPGRISRLRRSADPGVPQVVRQDARRPSRRPRGLADQGARDSGNRPHSVTSGSLRPGSPGSRRCDAAAAAHSGSATGSTVSARQTQLGSTSRRSHHFVLRGMEVWFAKKGIGRRTPTRRI